MDNSFFDYLQKLELFAFFSGYPLVYAVVSFIGNKNRLKTISKKGIDSLLPIGYALIGILFLGFQLKKLFPDYSLHNIVQTMQPPFLIVWGLFSILFFLPALNKKPVLSLVHSLVFFFFLLKDLFLHTFQSSIDKSVIKNDMKIYTDSLLLNLGVFVIIILISFLFTQLKKRLRR